MSHALTIEWMILSFLGASQTSATLSDSPAPADAECVASHHVRSAGLPGQESADGEDVPRPPGSQQDRLSAVPFNAVTFEDRFWAPRLETNRKVTLRHNLEELEKQGSLTGFAILAGDKSQKYRGWMWGDSDVYKTLEGMAYCLRTDPDPQREERLNQLVDMIVAAQAPDGYLAPHLQLAEPGYRHFADETTRTSESYNLGHLIESALAHGEATGRRDFVEAAIKCADLLARVQSEGELEQVAGHGEIELALVRLYRKTNNPKYLQVAAHYVRNARSMTTAYSPSKPFLADDEAVGHVVAAGYLYSGATDVAVLEGDTELLALLRRKWENVVARKLYLTGSAGLPRGEAFGAEYELPNAEAYCETCASIALVLWNHRMFLAHGEAKYVDFLERTLYNGVLSGAAMTGDRFFYPNPLTVPAARKYERTPWFDCPCCPVNIVRFLPQVPGLVFATLGQEVFVNLYAACSGSVQLGDQIVSLAQETRYPWDGAIRIAVRPEHPATFTVGMRIPGWANGRPVPSDLYRYAGDDNARAAAVQLKVNGQIVPLDVERGFARVKRQWKTGDCIELALPMTARRVIAHEALREDAGRVALERGPLVYCVEGADHNGRVLSLFLPDDAEIVDRHCADLLGGVTVLEGQAWALVRNSQGQVATEPAAMRAIPYYAWNHRGPGEMTVWIAREAARATPPPPPPPDTIAGRARATASHCWHRDTLVGLNDGVCPLNSQDQEPPRLTWWDHRGSEEWVQYDFPAPAEVSAVEVYWFDDSGTGGCRAPQSWRLLYLDGGQWRSVEDVSDCGIRLDAFNRVTFRPVRTSGLRIVVKLQREFSAGIIEWRVE